MASAAQSLSAWHERAADVAVCSRKLESCVSAAAEIRTLGRRALATSCHMGRRAEIDTFFDRTIAELCRVDIVVNNSATSPAARPLTLSTPELFDKVYAINVRGPLQLAARAAQRMGDHGVGAIVNVISVGAFLYPTFEVVGHRLGNGNAAREE